MKRIIKCAKCGIEVVATSFSQKYCPSCAKEEKKERDKRWCTKNPEKKKERNKQYCIKNPEKIKEYRKQYCIKNPEKIKERNKRWRIKNPEKMKEQRRKHRLLRYELTPEEYDRLCAEQGNVCKICGQPETRVNPRTGAVYPLAVDHDHKKTKRHVRQLLCFACNTGLGFIKEKISTLEEMIVFLAADHTMNVFTHLDLGCNKGWTKQKKARHDNLKINHPKLGGVYGYNYLYKKQDGKCAICKTHKEKLYVDHDHETDNIRGLVCHECNVALGRFKDNPAIIQKAIDGMLQATLWNF